MNKKEFNKRIKFCNDLVEIFSKYASDLDEYFSLEINREQHKELYVYYKSLIIDINDLKVGLNK